MAELTIISNPTNIAYNRVELAAAVQTIAERYSGVVEADKATAKHDRAEINKLLKQIDEARKATKRRYEEPYKVFEADLNTILEPLRAAAAKIDEQVKAYEAEERTARLEAIKAAWATRSWNVPFERIFSEEWLGASISEKRAIEMMLSAADMAENDLHAIISLGGDYQETLLACYNNGMSLADVLAYKKALETKAPPTPADSPLNTYTVTPLGVQVEAKKQTYSLMITCSEATLGSILKYLDGMGVFYAVREG